MNEKTCFLFLPTSDGKNKYRPWLIEDNPKIAIANRLSKRLVLALNMMPEFLKFMACLDAALYEAKMFLIT